MCIRDRTKDTVLDLISKFIFVEVKEKVDDQTGKVKRSENLIFPRYHQPVSYTHLSRIDSIWAISANAKKRQMPGQRMENI